LSEDGQAVAQEQRETTTRETGSVRLFQWKSFRQNGTIVFLVVAEVGCKNGSLWSGASS
jgi:hypothetical protein